LNLDVLGKILAIFFLFELLPSPIDLDVLLVRRYNFILNFFGPIAPQFLLNDTSLVLLRIGVSPNLGDDLGGLPLHLLEIALGLINLNITKGINFLGNGLFLGLLFV
jgi:hypothetical protein